MKEDATEERDWCEQIYAQLEAMADSSPFWNPSALPGWVQRVQVELMQQVFPASPLKKLKRATPRSIGLYLGQQCANCYAIGELLDVLPERIPEVEAMLSKLKPQQHLKPVESLLRVAEVGAFGFQEMVRSYSGFEATVHRAFKEALDQPSREEAAAFFSGFAAGISRPGLVKGNTESGEAGIQAAKPTSATAVYQRMFFQWREVEKLKTLEELREFLVASGLPANMVGDEERLARLCGRIGLAFRKRGRPRKRGNSDAPTA